MAVNNPQDVSIKLPHNIILESRTNLVLSGVCDVRSYNDSEILLVTSMGGLIISGTSLKIIKVNTDSGDAQVTGKIRTMQYTDVQGEKGFFKKLFK